MNSISMKRASVLLGILLLAGCEGNPPQGAAEDYNPEMLSAAASTQYEAENAALSGGANKNTNHSGYSEAGFVDGFYYSNTARVAFTVNVATAGSYTLTLRYSAGLGSSSNTGLYVNDSKIKTITCSGTSSWNAWADETETVMLKAGNNTVAYKAETSSASCINLDKLTVTGTCTPSTSACGGRQCGSASNGCGGTVSCGSCASGQTCSTAGQCTCTPSTSACGGRQCGSVSNGCGGTVSCGSCVSGKTCGSAGLCI